MASLPENWEWDYDGARWFYRYKPTGLVQYTFPKPGDEFPEFVDESVGRELAPEEKLVSQQQIKRRSTLGESSKRRERATSNAVSDPDDGSGPFWLQPDGLMYMGPGAYNDISPLQEEEEERGLESSRADETSNSDGAAAPATKTSTEIEKSKPAIPAGTDAASSDAAAPPTRSQISPIASAQNTPLAVNSQPTVATPELDSTAIAGSIPVDAVVEPPPEIHLLDSRPIPYNPIGFVAELASEMTARCNDEINPAPVEMPSNEIMMHTSEPTPYFYAFDIAPVELASDEAPVRRHPARDVVEEKSLASQNPGHEQVQVQQQRAYQAVQDLLNRPYRAVAPNPAPQSAGAHTQTPSPAPGPTPLEKFQPYNPSRHAAQAPAVNRYSTIEPQSRQPVSANNRHSLAGPALSQILPSHGVPLALQPAQPPSRRPMDSPDRSGQTAIPGSGARHESISGPVLKGASGNLAHFPSILQPARGRPVMRAQSPPQSQGGSPARTYQAYKPYHDLQRDIDDTVQLLSQTGYGQGATQSPEPTTAGRPQVSRTSTLPAHLPALPYMGIRPHLPHAATSDLSSLRSVQSHQALSGQHHNGGSIPSGGEAGMAIHQEYSAPMPPSSPDMPQPLNLSRKSPPPQGSVPTATSFRAPIATEPGMIFRVATPPVSLNTMVVSAPVMASPVVETNPRQEVVTAAHVDINAGQAESWAQGNSSAAPSLAYLTFTEHQGAARDTSIEQPQPAVHASPGHAVPKDFGVMPEPPIPPALKVAPATVTPEIVNQPAAATSFALEFTNIQAMPIRATHAALPAEDTTASEPPLLEAQIVGKDWQPATAAPQVTLQGANEPSASHPEAAASGEAQNSSHVVSSGHLPAPQVYHQLPPQPTQNLPIDQTVQTPGAGNAQSNVHVIADHTPAAQVQSQPLPQATVGQPADLYAQTQAFVNAQGASHFISNYPPAAQMHVISEPPTVQTHVISDYPPAIQTFHQHPPEPTHQSIQTRNPNPPNVSPSPPPTRERQSSLTNPGNGLDIQQAVTPPPPSITPRPPSPRTPSPVSRASSPPTQGSNIAQSIPSISPPAAATPGFQHTPATLRQASLVHDGTNAPSAGLPRPTTNTSSKTTPVADSPTPMYTLPSGHHPLASHPVNATPPRPAGPPIDRFQTAGPGSQQLPPGAFVQPGPGPQGPVGHPQGSGVHSQGPGEYPQGPGGHPQGPGAYPQGPGAQPQRHGVYPSGPGVPPQGHGVYPPGPGAFPQGPGTYPQGSGAHPQAPGGYFQGPGGYPQGPSVQAQGPSVQAQGPSVQAQGVQAQRPGIQAQAPAVQPQQPTVQAQQPAVEPQQPAVQPQQPAVQPQQPAVQPQQPAVQPHGPSVQPQGPSVQPQGPPATQTNFESTQSATASSQQQPPQAARAQTLPQPVAQSANTSQGSPVPAPQPFPAQQGAVSSAAPISDQVPSGQEPPIAGQTQVPVQSIKQATPTPNAESQVSGMPTDHGQPHPQRAFSHPVISQSVPPPHPGAPGTAPPQMHMMFAPPSMPPGMPMQGLQPGMPPQHHYAFQPGTFPQQGMQHQPMPPHLMQPGQMQGGPYVMQQPQPAQPAKEEKGWFGRLWRNDSVKKPSPSAVASPAAKLQKGPRPQMAPSFAPHLYPNQPGLPPQFAPPGTQIPPHMLMHPVQQAQQPLNMQQQQGPQQQPQQPRPHAQFQPQQGSQQPPQQPQSQPQAQFQQGPRPPQFQQQQGSQPLQFQQQPPQQQGPQPPQFQQQPQQQQQQQRQQQPPQLQQQQQSSTQFQQQQRQQPQQQQQPPPQFQQQQQPLAWNTNNGNTNQMPPQFHAPNNPNNANRPVMPPPQVRQAIQQQEQRLHSGGGTNPGTSGAGAVAGGDGKQQQVQRQNLGHGQGQAVQNGGGAGDGKGASGWGGASGSGYDGSGWGDEDDGEYR